MTRSNIKRHRRGGGETSGPMFLCLIFLNRKLNKFLSTAKWNRVSRTDGRDGSCSWNAVWLRRTARERKQRPHALEPFIFSNTLLLMKCSAFVCVWHGVKRKHLKNLKVTATTPLWINLLLSINKPSRLHLKILVSGYVF